MTVLHRASPEKLYEQTFSRQSMRTIALEGGSEEILRRFDLTVVFAVMSAAAARETMRKHGFDHEASRINRLLLNNMLKVTIGRLFGRFAQPGGWSAEWVDEDELVILEGLYRNCVLETSDCISKIDYDQLMPDDQNNVGIMTACIARAASDERAYKAITSATGEFLFTNLNLN